MASETTHEANRPSPKVSFSGIEKQKNGDGRDLNQNSSAREEDETGGDAANNTADDNLLQPEVDADAVRKRKRVITRNLWVLCIGFVFLVAPMQGLFVLQSSLNAEIGITGLGTNYISVFISCLLFSTFIVQRLGCKWSIVLGMSFITTWMVANIYPVWATIIPASVVMGLGWAPLWTGQCTYFTIMGVEYAKLSNQMPDAVIAKFFGVFFMMVTSGPIWGNLISAGILNSGKRSIGGSDASFNMSAANTSLSTAESAQDDSVYDNCGARFCPRGEMEYTNVTNENFEPPEQRLVFMLMGVFVGLAVLAIAIVAIFMTAEPAQGKEKPKCSIGLVLGTLKQLRNKYQLLLIPLTLYTGMEQAFVVVDYTRAFVTCTIGVGALGLVVICFALTSAVVALTSGQIVKKTGRFPVFMVGMASQLGVLIGSLFWRPHPDNLYAFFVVPVFWGIGDAIMQTQLNALYGSIFADTSEAAFSNYRMWESLGVVVSLSYSGTLCVGTKMYILFVVMGVGLVGYIATEVLLRRQKDREQAEEAEEGEQEKEPEMEVDTPFNQYANLMRRRSSMYVPESTVQQASDHIRKKSGQTFLPEKAPSIRRKISVFVPPDLLREEDEEGDKGGKVA